MTVTTLVHTCIRAVVRGLPLPEGGRCRIAGSELLVIARAKADDWPEVAITKGDLEAVAWVKPQDAERLADALLEDDHVVSVRLDAPAVDVG